MFREDWHIWVVKTNRFEHTERFLKEIPQIKEILYPTASKEFKLRSGAVKKKRVPLYSGYLFLRYEGTPELFHRLNNYPFLTTYVGRCRGEDLVKVKEVRQLEEWNVINRAFKIDDSVKITSGPFTGFVGDVVEIHSNDVVALIEVFGRPVRTTINKDNADIIQRT
jgi:transcriptional antiterminator NusG